MRWIPWEFIVLGVFLQQRRFCSCRCLYLLLLRCARFVAAAVCFCFCRCFIFLPGINFISHDFRLVFTRPSCVVGKVVLPSPERKKVERKKLERFQKTNRPTHQSKSLHHLLLQRTSSNGFRHLLNAGSSFTRILQPDMFPSNVALEVFHQSSSNNRPIGRLQKQVAQNEDDPARHVGGLDHGWLHKNSERQSTARVDCRRVHPAALWMLWSLAKNDVTW